MQQRKKAEIRRNAGDAERGLGADGKPAAPVPEADVGLRLVRVETEVADAKARAERSEECWEKWRSEDLQRHAEHRKEQAELREEMAAGHADLRREMAAGHADLRKEMAAGHADLRKEMAAGFAELRKEMAAGFQKADDKFEKVGERFDAMGKDIAACFRRIDEKAAEAKEATAELAQQFIRRVEVLALLILAAILGTGIFG